MTALETGAVTVLIKIDQVQIFFNGLAETGIHTNQGHPLTAPEKQLRVYCGWRVTNLKQLKNVKQLKASVEKSKLPGISGVKSL
ncbi:MAG: hypothetical protein AAGF01_11150 [Cyanobacteria bacterium P01_G01_bin.38]